MNIALTFKNFEPSDHLRKYAERRFAKLRRFAHKSENIEVTIVLTVDKFRHKADVQLFGDNLNISAEEQSSDMYATVDMIQDKLEAQLKKHTERLKEKRRAGGRKDVAPALEDMEQSPSRRSSLTIEHVELEPLYLEEAVLQFEHRPEDTVFVFINADESAINILYRRKNGEIGLIVPEV